MNRAQSRAHGYGLILLALAATACAMPASASRALSGASAAHSSQGYLGVDLRDISEDQVASLRLHDNHGAEIVLVDHDAPRRKRPAASTSTTSSSQMNGQPINGGDLEIRRMLHEVSLGQDESCSCISRDGQQITVSARLSTREEVERPGARAALPNQPAEQPDPAASESAAGSNPYPSASPAPAAKGGNSFIGSILSESLLHRRCARADDNAARPVLRRPHRHRPPLCAASSITRPPPRPVRARRRCGRPRANDKPVANTSDWYKAVKNSHGHALSVVVLRTTRRNRLSPSPPDSKKRSSLERAHRRLRAHRRHLPPQPQPHLSSLSPGSSVTPFLISTILPDFRRFALQKGSFPVRFAQESALSGLPLSFPV